MKKSNKVFKSNIAFWALMFIVLLALALGMFASCNTPEKSADRHFTKGMVKSQPTMGKNCSISFPIIQGKDSVLIYKDGEIVTIHDTVTDMTVQILNDTTYITKYITKTQLKRDTIIQYRKDVVHNAGKELNQAKDIENLNKELSQEKNNTSWWRFIAIISVCYTLLRWAVRYFSKGMVKLP